MYYSTEGSSEKQEVPELCLKSLGKQRFWRKKFWSLWDLNWKSRSELHGFIPYKQMCLISTHAAITYVTGGGSCIAPSMRRFRGCNRDRKFQGQFALKSAHWVLKANERELILVNRLAQHSGDTLLPKQHLHPEWEKSHCLFPRRGAQYPLRGLGRRVKSPQRAPWKLIQPISKTYLERQPEGTSVWSGMLGGWWARSDP